MLFNFSPSMEFIKNGKPNFKGISRDGLGRTKRIHAYVTMGSKCNSKCGFCRNQCFETSMMEDNYTKLEEKLEEFSPYVHTMIFGGGEPLLYADELFDILCSNYMAFSDVNSYIVTNGTREAFLKEVKGCRLCRKLDGILLSRHHYDDYENSRIFNNLNLLSENDIKYEICGASKQKMEFLITCINGGIDSADEIINFINWGYRLGIGKFLFNDLQKDVTDLDYWNENQISKNVFDDCEKKLINCGFSHDISVCYTAGYDVVTYIKGDARVGLKRYHESSSETIKKWKKSNKLTYDLSIMPNGDIFTDWANTKKI